MLKQNFYHPSKYAKIIIFFIFYFFFLLDVIINDQILGCINTGMSLVFGENPVFLALCQIELRGQPQKSFFPPFFPVRIKFQVIMVLHSFLFFKLCIILGEGTSWFLDSLSSFFLFITVRQNFNNSDTNIMKHFKCFSSFNASQTYSVPGQYWLPCQFSTLKELELLKV